MKGSIIGFVVPLGARLANGPLVGPSSTFLSRNLVSHAPSLATSSSTSLHMGAEKLADYTGPAIQFFMSERTTAALIAGASLSSLFSLVKLVKDVSDGPTKPSVTSVILARLYHALCLVAILLSLNVVVTATCACTMLFLEKHNGLAYSAYEFMFRELHYEYVTTRWSFLTALLSFIVSIATRSLLEFDLLKKGKKKVAAFVILSISALVFHLVSYVNSTLHTWPNLAAMTVDLLGTVIHTALNRAQKRPLELLSLLCGAGALGMFLVSTTLLGFGKSNAILKEKSEELTTGSGHASDGVVPG